MITYATLVHIKLKVAGQVLCQLNPVISLVTKTDRKAEYCLEKVLIQLVAESEDPKDFRAELCHHLQVITAHSGKST